MKLFLWVLAVVLAAPLALSILYLARGSLEQFPTPEQQGKVRIAAGAGVLVFGVIEALVVVALRRQQAGAAPSER